MAPPNLPSNSTSAGLKTPGSRNRTAEALYAWARKNHDLGHVFSQDELLNSGVIPDRDLQILLSSVKNLVENLLFRVHDRAGGTIGWELVDQGKAKNYTGLTRDEKLVLLIIDAASNSGIWTKVIKRRCQLHAKVLDRVYKSLEAKALIKPMKHVKTPGRKMYILAELEPSEEASGGAWFSEGQLDIGLLDTISQVVEHYVSRQSWQLVETDDFADLALSPGLKRKVPSAGFDANADDRAKAAKTNDGRQKTKGGKQTAPKTYTPFGAGHKLYPTLKDVTRHILDINVTPATLPQNAISQLLEVMVYDSRLFKMYRTPNDDELPDDAVANTVTMFRCFKTPADLLEQHHLEKRKVSANERVRKAAHRQQELELVGRGGSSEVPCMRCPVFDICGDGGLVNVETCKYFDQWHAVTAHVEADGGGGGGADTEPKAPDRARGRNPSKHKGRERDTDDASESEGLANGEPKIRVEIDLGPV